MSLENLLQQARACQICAESLPLGANPVVQAGKNARILIM
ncbi:IclR family transcriptional regulator, partial [Vibrio sp. S457-15]